MMLGFFLARAGIDVVVCEKHADFFRDFRGGTIPMRILDRVPSLRRIPGCIIGVGVRPEHIRTPHRS